MLVCPSCRFIGPYNYKSCGPIQEILSFINDSICVYKRNNIYYHKDFVDTCYWTYGKDNIIIIYSKEQSPSTSSLIQFVDSVESKNFDFLYDDICPKYYNLEDQDFKSIHLFTPLRYKFNLYYTFPRNLPPVQLVPIPKQNKSTFYTQFHYRPITCDTFILRSNCMIRTKHPVTYFLYNQHKRGPIKYYKREKITRFNSDKALFRWFYDSYEYHNYYVKNNQEEEAETCDLIGKTFSYLQDSCKKENIEFINDSICIYSSLSKSGTNSLFSPMQLDTCYYTTNGHLIAINFQNNINEYRDTLAFCNDILFYSKVYKNVCPNSEKKSSLIVKTFINDTIKWDDRIDSVAHILQSYYERYVPINIYSKKYSFNEDRNRFLN